MDVFVTPGGAVGFGLLVVVMEDITEVLTATGVGAADVAEVEEATTLSETGHNSVTAGMRGGIGAGVVTGDVERREVEVEVEVEAVVAATAATAAHGAAGVAIPASIVPVDLKALALDPFLTTCTPPVFPQTPPATDPDTAALRYPLASDFE